MIIKNTHIIQSCRRKFSPKSLLPSMLNFSHKFQQSSNRFSVDYYSRNICIRIFIIYFQFKCFAHSGTNESKCFITPCTVQGAPCSTRLTRSQRSAPRSSRQTRAASASCGLAGPWSPSSTTTARPSRSGRRSLSAVRTLTR